jgi:Excreted virulence factor EspC, type VII ESX diderm
MTGFDVLPGELRSHAGHVDGLADRLGEALYAARQVSMADDAYGVICQFLPSAINQLEQQANEALSAGQKGVSEIATNIRHTADEYERRDDDAAVMFGTLR